MSVKDSELSICVLSKRTQFIDCSCEQELKKLDASNRSVRYLFYLEHIERRRNPQNKSVVILEEIAIIYAGKKL